MPTVHFDAVIRKRGVGRPGFGRGPKSGGTFDVHSEMAEDSVDHCDVHITPACLRRLYGIPDSWQPKAADRNSLGIGRCLVLVRFIFCDLMWVVSRVYATRVSPGGSRHVLAFILSRAGG